MTCYRPIDCFRSAERNKNGKRPIIFSNSSQMSLESLQVQCGQCEGCLADKAMYWSIRMYHETTLHAKNSFITLTYDDQNCPDKIDKTELQKFFKRLRHRYNFRYFACGEHGSTTNRPHYHAVIFGENWLDGSTAINSDLYTNPILADIWSKGLVSIGNVTMGSCCYVAGYVNKKIGDTDTFRLCSTRPAIGSGWLDRYKDDLIRTGHVVIEGKKLPVPIAYIRRYEEEFEQLKLERAKIFKDMPPEEALARRDGRDAKAINKRAQLQRRKFTL